jgi:hypothetical protein
MNILTKLFGSDHQLTRPNFDKAPWLELNYSGLKIKFKDAPHNSIAPYSETIEKINLYNLNESGDEKASVYSIKMYQRSWEFKGRTRYPLGGVTVYGSIAYYPALRLQNKTYFDKGTFETEVLDIIKDSWGWQKKGQNSNPNTKDYIYSPPTKTDQLNHFYFNGNVWCRSKTDITDTPPQFEFLLPITSQHILCFSFRLSTYRGIPFDNIQSNIQETCLNVVEDFMKNVFVELSPTDKAERDELA